MVPIGWSLTPSDDFGPVSASRGRIRDRLQLNAANELRAVKTEAETFAMWVLDKKPFGGETDGESASPVLVAVALLLFAILVLAAIGLHHEVLIAAVGSHGLEPGFAGP